MCTALHHAGFTVVLTGGSAAAFYAPEAYQSKDLDFVITLKGTAGEAALRSLGYERKGDFYVHETSPFSLDFPLGPLESARISTFRGSRCTEMERSCTYSHRRILAETDWRPSCFGMTSVVLNKRSPCIALGPRR